MIVERHWLKGAIRKRATSYSRRQINPTLIVVHETSGRNDEFSTVRYLTGGSAKVSYHVVIERSGKITQLLPLNQTAWHAGKSGFNGRMWCNRFSIGVALVGPGPLDASGRAWFGASGAPEVIHKATGEHGDHHWQPFTEAQHKALREVCEAIIEYYPDCSAIAGHFEVSPRRKIDPNPLLEMDELRTSVFAPEVEPTVEEFDEQPGDPPVVSTTTKTGLTVGGVGAAVGVASSFQSLTAGVADLFPKTPTLATMAWPIGIMLATAVAVYLITRMRKE